MTRNKLRYRIIVRCGRKKVTEYVTVDRDVQAIDHATRMLRQFDGSTKRTKVNIKLVG